MAVYPRTCWYHSGSTSPSGADWYVSAEVYQLSQNYSLNTTTVRFDAYVNFSAQPTGAAGRYFEFQVSGNGSTNWNAGVGKYIAPAAGNSTVYLGTRDVTWYHNSAGQLSITSAIRGGYSSGSTYYWCNNIDVWNKALTLSNIPTVPTISNWINGVGTTSVTVGYSVSNYTNVEWQINGGTWSTVYTNPYTLGGLSSGTDCSVRTRAYKSSTGQYAYGSILTFTTLAVATVPTLNKSSMDMGDTIIITTTPDKAGYYHILYYNYGTSGIQLLTNGVTTGTTFTPNTTTFAPMFTNGPGGTCTIYCDTFTDGTYGVQVGTRQQVTFTLNVPASVIPTCSLVVEDTNSITKAWGIWVKGKSILQGTITASGIYGSTISSYSTPANGTTYTTNPFTTNTLSTLGSQNIVVTVRDSRNRTATDTETITVIDYSTPTYIKTEIKRCLVDGTLDDAGTYGKVVCEYSISSCSNKNAKSLKVTFGATTKTFTLSSYSGTYTAISSELFSGVTITENHLFTFKLIDSFETTGILQDYIVPPAKVLESDYHGGDGKCLGQIATRPGFDVHLDSTFFNELNRNIDDVDYKVLDANDIVQTLTTDTDKVPSANAVKNSTNKLVKELTVSNVTSFVVDTLDIDADGGVYDIDVEYYYSSGAPSQPTMIINNIVANYYFIRQMSLSNRTSDGLIPIDAYYYHNKGYFVFSRVDTTFIPSVSRITISKSNGHIHLQSTSESIASGGQHMAIWEGRIAQDSPPNITSLTFNNGGAGTFAWAKVRVWKR